VPVLSEMCAVHIPLINTRYLLILSLIYALETTRRLKKYSNQ
jgi:hypothetical protein